MDSVEDRLATLDAKVLALHHLAGRLEERILEILAHLKADSSASFPEQLSIANSEKPVSPAIRDSYQSYGIDGDLSYKDFLIDDNYQENETAEHHKLSPETQIRRLTAQLTAAYNRIAALEEQILASRVF